MSDLFKHYMANSICDAFNEPGQRFERLMFDGAHLDYPLYLIDDSEADHLVHLKLPTHRRFSCE